MHLQDRNSFAKGKSLFQSGLLSEAVLALEAEVQRQPQNVEAWRLLGTVHAENDDDQQVIQQCMMTWPGLRHCLTRLAAVHLVVDAYWSLRRPLSRAASS